MNSIYILAGLGIFSLIAEIANLRKYLFPIVMIGLVLSAGVCFTDWNLSSYYFSGMLLFDRPAISFSALISVIALLWLIMAQDYFHRSTEVTDHFAIVLFSLVGAVFMVSYHNMVMLFLGIEILSISLYVLAGSRLKDVLSNEAAFKYFIMGSFASSFLLFGIALIYGATGSFDLTAIAEKVSAGNLAFDSMLYGGMVMLLAGLAFKISAAPFHFWSPDVYQGSPTVITAFMSTIVKIAAFAGFYRLFITCFSDVSFQWTGVMKALVILTLLIGNITAVFQKNVKRLLAYSSISHAGYLLITLVALDEKGFDLILYYVFSYSVATLGAFTILHLLSPDEEEVTVESFYGLAGKNPFLAFMMTISVLSLAGIPPLAGFIAKYMIFSQAIEHGYLGVVLLAVFTSLVGVYYYFQLIIAMYFKPGNCDRIQLTLIIRFLLVVLAAASLLLGLFPAALNL
jgi:NADH-quinone oxidoreductase subunit N